MKLKKRESLDVFFSYRISDLLLREGTLLFDIQTAEKHMPFGLESRRSSNTDLCGRGRWETLDVPDSYNILTNLLHLDIFNIGNDITIVIQALQVSHPTHE